MNRTKYLMKNTTIFAIGNFSTKLIAFFLVPLYTNVLTKEDYGTIDLVFTICSILVPIVMFNIGEAVMRYSLDKGANHEQILSTALMAVAFGYVIGLLIIPIAQRINLINGYYLYTYAYTMLSATNTVLLCYLRGIEKLVSYTICHVVNSLSIAILNIIFLVVLDAGVKGYFMAYIISFFLSNVVAIIIGKHYRVFRHISFDKKLTKKMVGFSMALVPNSLLWWVTNSSGRILVTSIISPSENGLLTVAYKIPSLMTMLSTIFNHAWQYSAIKENNSEDKEEYHNFMFGSYTRFIVLVSASLLLILKPLMKFLVADIFYTSWRYSPFLIMGFAFLTLGSFVGTSYYVEKNMKGNLLSALVGAVANVLLNAFLIPLLGTNGASISNCLSYVIIFVYRVVDTKKYLRLDLKKKDYPILLGLILLMSVGNYIENGVGIAMMVLLYLLVLIINRDFIKDNLNKIISILLRLAKKRKGTADINA